MADFDEIKASDLPDYEFRSFLNRVHVKTIEIDEKTTGGIILPDKVRDKEQKGHAVGRVIDMGEDAYSDYKDKRLKIGDLVLYARYAGEAVINTGGMERIINDTDIYAIGHKKWEAT